MLRERLKWLMFPGLNLNARLRFRLLPAYFGRSETAGARSVLDAGCGNGMLSYQSCMLGNRVLGLSIKEGEVARNKQLFNGYHQIPESLLTFKVHNLYEVESLNQQFDEIICTEVMEHINEDRQVCTSFFKILKPGGVLHICSPNAGHPEHIRQHLDEKEQGGHVRAGYTYETYKALLEPIGFQLSPPVGVSGPIRSTCNNWITKAQETCGFWAGFALFCVLLPLTIFDPDAGRIPYSLYVRATKPR